MTDTFDPSNDDHATDEMEPFEAQFATATSEPTAEAATDAVTPGEDAPSEEAPGDVPVSDAGTGTDSANALDIFATPSTEDAIADVDAAEPTPGGELLEDAELLDVEEVPEAEPSPYDRPGRWYVVHTYAGYENKVKSNLASRVRSMNVEDRIYEVVIPMEDVIEFKNGRKVVVQKKVFPGYLLVRMALDDDAWYVVRNTPGVTGFVGSGAKPTHLSRREVEDILGTGEKIEGPAAEKKVRPRLEYEVAEQVRVVTGPFADFNGVISEIDVDRSKLKVLVNIFGRETPVELEFADVAKL
jgi:transcription termination/antitermination protein NusG